MARVPTFRPRRIAIRRICAGVAQQPCFVCGRLPRTPISSSSSSLGLKPSDALRCRSAVCTTVPWTTGASSKARGSTTRSIRFRRRSASGGAGRKTLGLKIDKYSIDRSPTPSILGLQFGSHGYGLAQESNFRRLGWCGTRGNQNLFVPPTALDKQRTCPGLLRRLNQSVSQGSQ
jgi:hypothetical protein